MLFSLARLAHLCPGQSTREFIGMLQSTQGCGMRPSPLLAPRKLKRDTVEVAQAHHGVLKGGDIAGCA